MTLHLSAALDGAGWHPAAWRDPSARPSALFKARYWAALAAEAELGLLDFVTFEDSYALQSSRTDGHDGRTDQVRGRFDAVLLAARLATATSHLGLVPTTSTTHAEPFHVSIGIASLDHATRGRAGWRPQIHARAADARHFGRRVFPVLDPAVADQGLPRSLFDEAGEFAEVVGRLWDSWEDDAEIRDVASGRFVDRDKLHYIDFAGAAFSVRGPSITPRPPQGRPPITLLAHEATGYELAARHADVVYVTPQDHDDAVRRIGAVRAAERATGRTGPPLKVFADLLVLFDGAERKERLDRLDGAELTSDALIFTGSPVELADLLLDWRDAGYAGFRLRPGVLPLDLVTISRALVPELQRRGAYRTGYAETTLRERLGLPGPRPPGRRRQGPLRRGRRRRDRA
ncbi:LLM class flavin-dependent oxidoreductase, partial [Actinocorallia lasiicapitis]